MVLSIWLFRLGFFEMGVDAADFFGNRIYLFIFEIFRMLLIFGRNFFKISDRKIQVRKYENDHSFSKGQNIWVIWGNEECFVRTHPVLLRFNNFGNFSQNS